MIEQQLLTRKWYLDDPSTPITPIYLKNNNNNNNHSSSSKPSFYILRDDLTHPYISGNKRRKLDALWPELLDQNIQDIVTCGGSQSAHLVAIASAAAEHNIRSHLLIRGEAPQVCTGNHLFARMLAHQVIYVSRQEYADRDAMLLKYSSLIRNGDGSGGGGVAVIAEGAAEASSLLGMIRFIHWMAGIVINSTDSTSDSTTSTTNKSVKIVVDCGTGTTAIGLALGIVLLGLSHWNVVGVMLAAPKEYYVEQTISLIESFYEKESSILQNIPLLSSDTTTTTDNTNTNNTNIKHYLIEQVHNHIQWIERKNTNQKRRKFGRIFPEDIRKCQSIAQNYGVIVDPIWSLAAWETTEELITTTTSTSSSTSTTLGDYNDDVDSDDNDSIVYMLHSGGALGLNGVAQRYPNEF